MPSSKLDKEREQIRELFQLLNNNSQTGGDGCGGEKGST